MRRRRVNRVFTGSKKLGDGVSGCKVEFAFLLRGSAFRRGSKVWNSEDLRAWDSLDGALCQGSAHVCQNGSWEGFEENSGELCK